MKKSVWIFLFAVLLPSVVLGWLALRSAEEQQIVFERRTAELYQKETESLAVTVRDTVDAERRVFGETVHRLLAKGDAEALARDFTNTLADAWNVTAVGFAIGRDGKLVAPSVAAASKQPDLQRFLLGNGGFLTSTEPAIVYNWAGDNNAYRNTKLDPARGKAVAGNLSSTVANPAGAAGSESQEALQKSDPAFAGGDVAATASRTRAPGGRAEQTGDREELPSRGVNSPAPDAADAQKKARAFGGKNAVPEKMAEPTPARDFAKNPPGAPDEMRADLAPVKAMPAPVAAPATPAAKDRERESAALSPQPRAAWTMSRRTEGKSEGEMREQKKMAAASAPVAPASRTAPPAPGEKSAPATTLLKAKAQNFPAPEPQADAPMPVPPRKSEAAQTARKAEDATAAKKGDEALVEVALMTKTGVGSLALGNAINRQVEPQQLLGAQSAALSTVLPETAEFRSLTEEGDDGLVARFVQDKLNLIFWVRPPEAPEMIFGCLVEAGHFSDVWKEVLQRQQTSSRGARAALESKPEFVLALLDDRGKPVATQPANAGARDWKHPFVASEIGEALPHWEAALYLASPTALAESARGLWRTLAFTIAGMVALIALGGWLVVADARRQLALAQQKTDFVSNVSHELKTPLTSIRMFAELMHDRPQPPEKQGQYLRIITVEAERLTRLINNVLDFAKIGRKQRRIEKKPLDLCALVAGVWESQELHLREAGFETRWEAEPGPYPVLGDDDALAQVLVNLISNAEKYSTEKKCVELHSWLDGGWVNVSVLDCGMGVPDGDAKKIFEAFYRAHDSLSSGIQGSGLGLTLAQRIAREHGGEIKLEHRDGGGCRFTLRLPLAGGKLRAES